MNWAYKNVREIYVIRFPTLSLISIFPDHFLFLVQTCFSVSFFVYLPSLYVSPQLSLYFFLSLSRTLSHSLSKTSVLFPWWLSIRSFPSLAFSFVPPFLSSHCFYHNYLFHSHWLSLSLHLLLFTLFPLSTPSLLLFWDFFSYYPSSLLDSISQMSYHLFVLSFLKWNPSYHCCRQSRWSAALCLWGTPGSCRPDRSSPDLAGCQLYSAGRASGSR